VGWRRRRGGGKMVSWRWGGKAQGSRRLQ
jgi:hypothetical protein